MSRPPSTLILWYVVLAFGMMFGGDFAGAPRLAFVGGVLVLLLFLAVAIAVTYLAFDRFRTRRP
jgi:hypothetical protein